MYSAYVSRQTDSSRQITGLNFCALWQYFKQKYRCSGFNSHMLVAPLQQELEQVFSGSDERGKIWHYKKVSFLFLSPLPAARRNTCLISRGTEGMGLQAPLSPKILYASFSSTLLVMFHHWHSYTWTLWCCQTPGLIFPFPNENKHNLLLRMQQMRSSWQIVLVYAE